MLDAEISYTLKLFPRENFPNWIMPIVSTDSTTSLSLSRRIDHLDDISTFDIASEDSQSSWSGD